MAVPAQSMIVLGISYPATPVISAVAGLTKAVRFVTPQAMVALRIVTRPRPS
jgi:hypothetical protein